MVDVKKMELFRALSNLLYSQFSEIVFYMDFEKYIRTQSCQAEQAVDLINSAKDLNKIELLISSLNNIYHNKIQTSYEAVECNSCRAKKETVLNNKRICLYCGNDK
jgi:hypothetical protein